MRLIDVDELPKVKFHPLPYTHIVPSDLKDLQTEAYERGWNDAIDAIVENADTVDVVKVVRCRDCRWFAEGKWCRNPNNDMVQGGTIGEWFCGDGKRKGGDE